MDKAKFQILVKEILSGVQEIAKNDLESIILYGSYARGDYDKESDFDIAILLRCSRMEMKKYTNVLADLMVDLNLEHDVLVNFCCIPYNEYIEKKDVLPYYMSIEREGVSLIA